ncbi:MAG TPA: hypothetical protein VHK65_08555 [Candidatus Dormibacteraeota bacterium]|nr:hypothetical protein [Candidatus Dormibacteraeota bacterium]
MTPSRKLHKNDKLCGAVAEALVAAYALISAGGKLSSYRPFTDVDGKDIIIDLAGGFQGIYLQVKCALGLNRDRRIRGTVRLYRGHIPSDPKFIYVFCLLDKQKMEPTRLWVVPAAQFYKPAYRTSLAKGMVQFNFDCRTTGDARWDEFEITRSELGPRLVELIRAAAKSGRRARMETQEQLDGRWLQLVA